MLASPFVCHPDAAADTVAICRRRRQHLAYYGYSSYRSSLVPPQPTAPFRVCRSQPPGTRTHLPARVASSGLPGVASRPISRCAVTASAEVGLVTVYTCRHFVAQGTLDLSYRRCESGSAFYQCGPSAHQSISYTSDLLHQAPASFDGSANEYVDAPRSSSSHRHFCWPGLAGPTPLPPRPYSAQGRRSSTSVLELHRP
ncbi:hypothetical protein N658DRAFT_42122 [Parathielavia hyrcaniae]|uniref:Uncharacterized protein n=1 Tax=Parathielavia hyrcaniae TaxID=113614 RepID=A0AAN6T2S4_9PEZI|nr:hypothetical protein N658DRAFT_42122 [Parathielavia hyrcaniae]